MTPPQTPTQQNQAEFIQAVTRIYNSVKSLSTGKVADYIPQLEKVPRHKFAISVCFVDGTQFSIGDSNDFFTLQSTSKPLTYLVCQQLHGTEYVHKFMGREPSGSKFNAYTFDSNNLPHNPLLNAGAIMCCSLMKPQESTSERYEYFYKKCRKIVKNVEKTNKKFSFSLQNSNNSAYISHIPNSNVSESSNSSNMPETHSTSSNETSASEPILLFSSLENHESTPISLSNGDEKALTPQKNPIYSPNPIKPQSPHGHVLPQKESPVFQGTCHQIMISDVSCGISYDNSTYLSEKLNANRNRALAYMMKDFNVFPKHSNVEEALDLYFQTCSIMMTSRAHARMAGCLANNGKNPISKRKLFHPAHVRNTLTLMYSCGMYDYSGTWAFEVGIPAKSGVSGAILMVIPNFCGISVWSPPLDKHGNSCRGIKFAQLLSQSFDFHTFSNHQGCFNRSIVVSRHFESFSLKQLIFDCDLSTLKSSLASYSDINACNFDKRTALHLAVSEKQVEIIALLLQHGANPTLKDRWGNSPISEAKQFSNPEIYLLLLKYCGNCENSKNSENSTNSKNSIVEK